MTTLESLRQWKPERRAPFCAHLPYAAFASGPVLVNDGGQYCANAGRSGQEAGIPSSLRFPGG